MKTFLGIMSLLLAGATDAVAAQCDRLAVEITTTPVLYQWTSALEKATGLLDAPPKRADTVLLGDSLLAFWPRDLAERQFASADIWNFAVGGSRTQHILWQLRALGDRGPAGPGEVILLIGTNNLTDETLPACAILEGIKAVALKARDQWPHARIHVMGIPPRGSDFRFRDNDRKAINAALRAWVGVETRIGYFEVDEMVMTCGRYAGVKMASVKSAPPENRCPNYADDFGHFRRAGYEVIYTALRGGTKEN